MLEPSLSQKVWLYSPHAVLPLPTSALSGRVQESLLDERRVPFLREVQGRLIDEHRALSLLPPPLLQSWHVLTQHILLYWLSSLLCSVFHPCSFFYKDFSSPARQGREGFAILEKMHLTFKLLFLWQDTSFKHLKSLNTFLSSNLWVTVTYSKLTILCKHAYHLRNLPIYHHPWLLRASPLFIHLNRILLFICKSVYATWIISSHVLTILPEIMML